MEAHVLGPEHAVQDAGEDVLGGQGSDHVPDDTRLLVDIGDGQHRAVGKGQGAPVGRLAAALGVKHRAVQRDAPAAGPAVWLCG